MIKKRKQISSLGGSAFILKTNQVFIDIAIFVLSVYSAFFIRFEGIPDPENLKQLLVFFTFISLARVVSFYLFTVYSIAWRYISIRDVMTIVQASLPVSLLLLIGRMFLPVRLQLFRIPYSIIALEFMFALLGTLSARMSRRLLHENSERAQFEESGIVPKRKKVLLVGAGNAGNLIIRELRSRPDLGLDVLGFIDDDPKKLHSEIQKIEVLGDSNQIPEIVSRLAIDEVIITIANASSKDIRRIVDISKRTAVKIKIVPGLFEMLDDNITLTKIREINIDDLLGRSVVHLKNNSPEILSHYREQVILVTGAGGSIGSELCRQLSSFSPRTLILLDKDENSVYEIDSELHQRKACNLISVVADIRNESRMRSIFQQWRPEIVFHAAAHKHVPLMEINPVDAVLNNVAGTWNIIRLADEYRVRNMLYISTDKAVNPTSIMGTTKKIGEILIQEQASKSNTHFSCVRFGNVLGSRGSVVPMFKKQIKNGGPITITDPGITRYFMSISEAVQLIIKAATLGDMGEIFVLDMGEPILILDLARDLIRLSGYREDEIGINYIGLRKGEKLFEETMIDAEKDAATQYEKIFISSPVRIENEFFWQNLESLIKAAEESNEARTLEIIRSLMMVFNTSAPSENRISTVLH